MRRAGLIALACTAAYAGPRITRAASPADWLNPVDGNWVDATMWSTGQVPNNGVRAGPTYDAVLGATGAPHVVSFTASARLDSLTNNSTDATLRQTGGALTVLGGFHVGAGAYELHGGGLLSGGSLTQAGDGRVRVFNGSFENVQVTGDLTVRNGTLNMYGTSAYHGGRIGIEAYTNRAVLRFAGADFSLDAATEIVFDGTSSNAMIEVDSGTLTLGAQALVRSGQSGGEIGTFFGGSLINEGTISSRTPGKVVTVGGIEVRHRGLFEAVNGGKLVARGLTGDLGAVVVAANSRLELWGGGLVNLTTFANARPIQASNGAYLTLGGSWTNSGPITVNGATLELNGLATNTGTITLNGGTLVLGGSTALDTPSPSLGTVNLTDSTIDVTGRYRGSQFAGLVSGGSVRAFLTGVLNDGFADGLTLSQGGPAWHLAGGSLYGAVTTPDGSVLTATGAKPGSLVNVILDAPLVIQAGSTVNAQRLRGKARIDNAGTLNLIGGAANPVFTLDGAWSNTGTINVTGALLNLGGTPASFGNITANGTATIGVALAATTAQVRAIAAGTAVTFAVIPGGTLDNAADVIDLSASSPAWRLAGGRISGGAIRSPAGRAFAIGGTAAGTLDGVTLATATELTGPLRVTGGMTLDAPLNLRAGGSVLFDGDQSLGGTGEARLDTPTFMQFGSTNGTLTVLPGVTVRATRGLLSLGGSSPVPLVNQGTIRSQTNGTSVSIGGASFVNSGLVEASAGGSVLIGAPVSGTGTLSAGAGSSLTVRGGSQERLVADGAVTLTRRSNGGQTLAVGKLAIAGAPGAWTGKLDLTDNALVIDYTGPTPLATTADQIRAGHAGGAWNGNGIRTSAANVTSGLGYAEASDVLGLLDPQTTSWLGQTVDATSVLVRYTLLGDATLDGAVTFPDLVRLAQNYNSTDGAAHWSAGDFTYDGNVDFQDLVKLAQNYGGAPPAPTGISATFDADLARAFASVPEPGAAILALSATPLLAARQRRRA